MNNLHENEIFGCSKRNPLYCMTCANSQGEAPWADGPEKSYCSAYPRELGRQKPASVYIDGGHCAYYERA